MKIETNGIETHYTVDGEGPWLVFSHSLACDTRMWKPQIEAFSKRYKVLCYDTRGHGGSSAPAEAYTLDQLADDAKALFDGLGIKSCHWVGLSMGGMIGQTFALRHPGIFQTMTLADTTSYYPPEAQPLWQQRIRIATDSGMEPIVPAMLERWFTEPFRKSGAPILGEIAAAIRGTPPQGFAGCCHALPKINLTSRLKEIACPTLVVVGEHDPGTPVSMAQDIHAAMPGSQLVVLPNAAHLSNAEQPAAFNAALQSFLDRHA
jgi:3-oxoadipate enol-lactonase